ncbi:MAG: efflux RND transporter permease subunit [Deltaproteobacteria bacterium]|nr:efflux RND transporter permease subunit [Deltaproteobacteria bacterium]
MQRPSPLYRLARRYARSLKGVLSHPRGAGGALALLLALGLGLVPWLGTEFLPRVDDGRVTIKVRLPTGSSVAQTDAALRHVESLVAEDPLVESAFSLVGGKVWGLYTYEIANEGQLDIQMVPWGERDASTLDYVAQLQERLEASPPPAGRAMPMQANLKGVRSANMSELDVQLRGPDMETLDALAGQIQREMSRAPFLRNVYLSVDKDKPEIQVRPDRLRLGELGLTAADLAGSLRRLVHGDVASVYREDDEDYDIHVLVPEASLPSRASLESLPLRCTPGGGCLRVSDVASVEEAMGPLEIIRQDQVRQVVISANSASVSVGEALEGLEALLERIDLPPGYTVEYGGQARLMADARRDLVAVVLFALFFALVVLVVQFNRLRIPFLILSTVPFSLSGMAVALTLAGIPLGTTVVIGLMVVVAAHVTEGVLLLTYAETARTERGLDAGAAVVDAATIRFRPRLMTALGVVAGLTPIALEFEEGGDLLQPMAVGAIGGLLTMMVVALYFVPVLYVLSNRRAG